MGKYHHAKSETAPVLIKPKVQLWEFCFCFIW